jgi:hypothetical protein
MQGWPEGINYSIKYPEIYFFPAYHKGYPYKKYTGKLSVQELLKFVLTHADNINAIEKDKVLV